MPECNFHTGHLFLTAISNTLILVSWDYGHHYVMYMCYSRENSAKPLCAAVWWWKIKYNCTACRKRHLGNTKNFGRPRLLDTGVNKSIAGWGNQPKQSTPHQNCSWCFTLRLQEIGMIKLFFRWSSHLVYKGELLSAALLLHAGNGQTEGRQKKCWGQMKMLDKIHFGNGNTGAVLVSPEHLIPYTVVSIIQAASWFW